MLQTRIKNRPIRCGIVILALLAVLPGTPVVAEQTFDKAVAAYERRDYVTAMRGFRVHAEQGNAEAQVALGVMYDRGEGVPQNYIEAAKWYRKAAEQGHASAQANLGGLYGAPGVPENDAEAVKWYRKAAEQGHASAQLNLGVKYDLGEGVPEDEAEAVRWYRLAAEQGHADAQNNLGVMYAIGRGVLKDDAEAGAGRRAGERRYNLGVRYANGRGVLGEAEAVRWWLAAEQGHAKAQFNLGLTYEQGCRRMIRCGVVPQGAHASAPTSVSCTTTGGAFSRTRPKLCAGTGWPPSRGTPVPKTTSGSCTPTGGAFSRIPCLRTCGPTSLAQTGTQAPGSCGTVLNVT